MDSAAGTPLSSAVRLAQMNRDCLCAPVERRSVLRKIESVSRPAHTLLTDRNALYAGTAVFVRKTDFAEMLRLMEAVETTAAHPTYSAKVVARYRPGLLNIQPATRGLFMGYDFHVTADGPKLIEINTNAGGAFLAKMLSDVAGEQAACCVGKPQFPESEIDEAILDMFQTEWRLGGQKGSLATVAIVDENSASQYLYPEMMLASRLLSARGIDTIICNVADLKYASGQLTARGRIIDLIYNRSTDFMLESPAARPLKQAWENHHTLVSPSPRHHALYADKRNLAILADPQFTREMPRESASAMRKMIPNTLPLQALAEASTWRQRRKLFFKPVDGFGSRAVYRGDKLTRRTWAAIQKQDYVAQELVPAPVRRTTAGALKYDVRIYSYGAKPLFPVARLYAGQTTNFRTDGGGFAPVILV